MRTVYEGPPPAGGDRPSLVVSLVVSDVESDAALHFRYADGSEFLIDREGRSVWCSRPAGARLDETAAYLRGPILGIVLRLRGLVCLHASSVAVGGRVIAMLGMGGAGKSTTAAALLQLGHRLVADDVTVLRPDGDWLLVEPGPPRLTLCPDAADALFGANTLPRLFPGDDDAARSLSDKRYLDVTETERSSGPLPLAGVYLLDPRASWPSPPSIVPLDPTDAFLALTEDTYVNYALDGPMRAREFDVLGRLVRRLPVRRVIRNQDLAGIGDVCRAILEDAHAGASAHDRS